MATLDTDKSGKAGLSEWFGYITLVASKSEDEAQRLLDLFDGQLTRAAAAAAERAAAPPALDLDKDGDGKVSMAELTTEEKSEAEQMFAQFDKNGDGKLSMKEGKEAIKAIFDQQGSSLVSFDAIWSAYDKDDNFFISLEEFVVLHGALFKGKFESEDLMRKASKRPVSV